ncbi:DUF2341 domain-containing protein [Haliangium sp.]|uniref:DUF2341 domain-containing protein n=1 Tax=Haliangium sp. TaxID=2663208 RepID=UPI003D0C8494
MISYLRAIGIAILCCAGCSFDGSGLGGTAFDASPPPPPSPDAANPIADAAPVVPDAIVPDADLRPPARRKLLTLQPGLNGASLTDFPLPVLLAADAQLVAEARSDGRDILFVDSDGVTVLDHEIERYDSTTGALVAWVRVPTLSDGGRIYMTYGVDAADADRQAPAAVWAGFTGVWHLSEPPADGAVYRDSTGNGHDGSNQQSEVPTAASGIAGPGLAFDGNNDRISLDNADNGLDPGDASFSLSAWVEVVATADDRDLVWYKGAFEANLAGYELSLGSGEWQARISDGNDGRTLAFSSQPLLNQWRHLAAVVDRKENLFLVYVDGMLVDQATLDAIDAINPVAITPRIGDETHPFRGVADEVRLYDGALSAPWLQVEANSLLNPGVVVQVGTEEMAPYPIIP